MPKLVSEQFTNGQQSYARGVGLRTIIEQSEALASDGKENESFSLAFGYLDGVCASIRRIDNLLMQGPLTK